MRTKDSSAPVLPYILPACCICQRVSDLGTWRSFDRFLSLYRLTEHEVQLSHTYCPPCYERQIEAWHLPALAPAPRHRSKRLRSVR